MVGQVEEGDECQAVCKRQRAREHDGRRPREPLEAVDRGGEALGVGLHELSLDYRPLLAQVSEQRIHAAEQVASLEQLGTLGVWPQQRQPELVCGGEQLEVARPLGGLAERHLLEQHHREHHALVRYLQLLERLAQLCALGPLGGEVEPARHGEHRLARLQRLLGREAHAEALYARGTHLGRRQQAALLEPLIKGGERVGAHGRRAQRDLGMAASRAQVWVGPEEAAEACRDRDQGAGNAQRHRGARLLRWEGGRGGTSAVAPSEM